MSEPELLFTDPDLPVALPDLPAQQVALALAGLASHSRRLTYFRERHIVSEEGFRFRHDPIVAAADYLEAVLAAWHEVHGKPEGEDPLTAAWPQGQDVVLGEMPVAQVYAMRLGMDFLFFDREDEDLSDVPPELGYPESWGPMLQAHQAIRLSLVPCGVEELLGDDEVDDEEAGGDEQADGDGQAAGAGKDGPGEE